MNHNNFAIVLAAGSSQRMGICKASLPWHDHQTLLAYQASQLLWAGFTPIVVLGTHNADRQQDCPQGTYITINPDPSRGKTSSILTGLQAIPKIWQTLIISAVDQPRPAEIYQVLWQSHQQSQALITAPVYAGRIGHPLLFSHEMLGHLEAITEATYGLRAIVQRFHDAIHKVEFDTAIVLSDLNYPDRYYKTKAKLTEERDNEG